MKRRYLPLLAVIPVGLALVFLIPFIKKADTSPRPTTPSEMAELVETIKIWKLVDAVSPTSEQKLPLLSQFNKLEKLKAQYRLEHRQSMNRLKQLQATPAPELAELQAALAHHHEVENGFIADRQQIMDELNQFLTVEQQAQFVLFNYSYRQELKQALQTLIALQEQGRGKDILAAKSAIK